ncbi:MAG: TatD family hydrolase [Anaerolineae bacterium]|nr:TatD family hydrolase [Anaerolineae bacterium]
MLVDSHAHLSFAQFDADRDAVIRRAREAGVTAILEVGADLESSRAAVALAERYTFIYATVGVHPHDATALTPGALAELRALASHPKVVAIGEIGLDYYRDLSPRDVQRRAFEAQLALAADGRPVVIHCREALDEVLAILRGWKGSGVMHSYSGGPGRLDEVLALGFCVSLSGPVTFPKSERLRAVAAAVPLDRLLVETDCPYLTPEPYRGRRNEPAYVRYVVEAVARARGLSAEAVARATAENARRLFAGLSPGH